MKSSIFSDTDSSKQKHQNKEQQQNYGSPTKSEGSRFKASSIFRAQSKSASKQDDKPFSSKSYLLKSIVDSEEDVYTPTKASSYCMEEFEDDGQSDIEEMRQLINQNKQAFNPFYSGTSKQQRSFQIDNLYQPKVSNTPLFELNRDNTRQWIWRLFIFVIILLFLGALYKIRRSEKKEDAINTLGNGLLTCWDNFKKENCDLSNPVGPYCKKLLECTLNKQDYDKEKYKKNQEQPESIIEEACVIGVLSALIYLFGVKKTMRLFVMIFNFLKKMYQLKKDQSQASQTEDDSDHTNQ